MSKMADIQDNESSWEEIVNKMSLYNNSKSIWEIIRKLCLGATTYFIWQERNGRLFSDNKRSAEGLFSIISDEVRAKIVSIKVKQNASVIKAENKQNVKFDRKVRKYAQWNKGVFGSVDKSNIQAKYIGYLLHQAITFEKHLVTWSPNWETVPILPHSLFWFGFGGEPRSYTGSIGGFLSMDVP